MKMNKIVGTLFAAMMLISSALVSAETSSIKPNDCKGPVLCPSWPIYGATDTECDQRWHLNVGYLFEQPWMSDMAAGSADVGGNIDSAPTSGTTHPNVTNTYLEVCFDYSSGVVAGVGYFMEHDDWFLLAEFDWISAGTSKSYGDSGVIYHTIGFVNTNVMLPFHTPPSPDAWDSITYKANLDIYDVDFVLSRGSFHSKCFSYEPFAGIKALWYNGNQQRRYYGTVNGPFTIANEYFQSSIAYSAWGVGPEFGFNGEYFVTQNFSFFSNSDIGVLYGKINSKNIDCYVDPTELNNETDGVATYVQNFSQPYFVPVRSIVGVKFARYCLEDKHYIALKIGYDARYVIGDSGMDGEGGSEPRNGYNVASNGLFLSFIWNV